jgi:uncharacterized protein (TIGR00369 family)
MRELFPSDIAPGFDCAIVEVDHPSGRAELRFELQGSTANQLGFVQGGTVATMFDACLGIAGAVKSGGVLAMPLIQMQISFVRPVPVGVVSGVGHTTRLGRSVAFLVATLAGPDGGILARATATAAPTATRFAMRRSESATRSLPCRRHRRIVPRSMRERRPSCEWPGPTTHAATPGGSRREPRTHTLRGTLPLSFRSGRMILCPTSAVGPNMQGQPPSMTAIPCSRAYCAASGS